MLGRMLLRGAKSPAMGALAGWAFRLCPGLLPVKRVLLTPALVAFKHPRPAYANHVILSPRRAVRSLTQLAQEEAPLGSILAAVQEIAAAQAAYAPGFTLAANGGRRQEVQQVHFHLFTGHDMVGDGGEMAGDDGELFRCGTVRVLRHALPAWERHLLLAPGEEADRHAYLRDVLRCVARLAEDDDLQAMGYSLVCRQQGREEAALPAFHLVAGRRLK